jgi:hypothetical protein
MSVFPAQQSTEWNVLHNNPFAQNFCLKPTLNGCEMNQATPETYFVHFEQARIDFGPRPHPDRNGIQLRRMLMKRALFHVMYPAYGHEVEVILRKRWVQNGRNRNVALVYHGRFC